MGDDRRLHDIHWLCPPTVINGCQYSSLVDTILPATLVTLSWHSSTSLTPQYDGLITAAALLASANLPQSTALVHQPNHLTVFEHVGNMVPDVSLLHIMVPLNLDMHQNMFENAMAAVKEEFEGAKTSKKYTNEIYYNPNKAKMHDIYVSPTSELGEKANISLYHDLMSVYNHFMDIRAALPSSSTSLQATTLRGNSSAEQSLHHSETDGQYLHGMRRGMYNSGASRGRWTKRNWLMAVASLLTVGAMGTFMGTFSSSQIHSLGNIQDMEILIQGNKLHNYMTNALNI